MIIDARIVDYDNSNHDDVADQACNGWDVSTIHYPVVISRPMHARILFLCLGTDNW
jgi:hypothetical protein